ncbi:translation initiation factor IF-2 [Candidatus Uhrbacteria bacterium]|nr:translation initiation factor IF-2 [Candidatus Uhrbacteria bacterium]
MNITELARRLRVSPTVLFDLLPKMGFDIGKRAIKVDPRTAQRIIREWKIKIAELQRQQEIEKRMAEKEERRQKQTEAIHLPPVIAVRDFAVKLNLPVTAIIKELMTQGVLATVNEMIDFETASIIAQDLGFQTVAEDHAPSVEKELEQARAAKPSLPEINANDPVRPPVVVVMGHIDHGKTKLLDAIRKTQVVEQEHGGITQHIGAYQITVNNRKITFIDTPGHEAFMSMRARGARVADIAILVVAADDGVKPQTLETIQIIRGAELPMIVAINKIDKPEANIDKTKSQLADHNVIGEQWGGAVPMVPISAKEGKGIKELLEVILLVADVNPDRLRAAAEGTAHAAVIESRVDKREGVVATVLVQQGTLKRNDPLSVGGVGYGHVRILRDEHGRPIEEATPSTPARVLGFKVAPAVGDIVDAVESEEMVRKTAASGNRSQQLLNALSRVNVRPEDDSKKHRIPLIIKADVLGSLEAVLSELQKIEHPEVGVTVIHKGLGAISDADVARAVDTNAILLGFNVMTLPTAANFAHEKNVDMRSFTVIYHLLDSIKQDLEKILTPEIRKIPLGRIQVVRIFSAAGRMTTAGTRVLEGRMLPKDVVDVERASVAIGRATVVEIRSGKETVNKVESGQECGMRLNSRDPIKENDVLVPFREEKITRTLEG